MADGFLRTDDAVGGVGAFEDLIDADEHGLLLAAELDHLLDAQEFGVEGRYALGQVIVDLDGGEDMQRRQRELCGTDRCAGIGEDGCTGKRAHIGGFAAHVRSRDDMRACGKPGIVRDGFLLGEQQGAEAAGAQGRRACCQLREYPCCPRVADRRQ